MYSHFSTNFSLIISYQAAALSRPVGLWTFKLAHNILYPSRPQKFLQDHPAVRNTDDGDVAEQLRSSRQAQPVPAGDGVHPGTGGHCGGAALTRTAQENHLEGQRRKALYHAL